MDETIRQAVLKKILDERDQLVLARLEVRRRLREVQMEDNALRRALYDRKAAGRVFNQVVAVPPRDEDYDSREALDAAMTALRADKPWIPGESVPTPENMIEAEEAASADPMMQYPPEATMRISDLILQHLKERGGAGTTASEIRTWLDRKYGIKTHEKTPGMTLYRLSRDGLVSREGRTWFLTSARAEKGNPGGETPGHSDVLD